jgi:hypothetical protein
MCLRNFGLYFSACLGILIVSITIIIIQELYWNSINSLIHIFVMEEFIQFMWLSVTPRFKFSGMFCMNEHKVLVFREQMHWECMIILKVGINLFVTWIFFVQLFWRKRGGNCELICTIMRKECTILSELPLRHYYSDSDKHTIATERE